MNLNLGCGDNWRLYPDYEGIDINNHGQKYVGDVLGTLISLQEEHYGKIEGIMANHFLEHLDQEVIRMVLNECHDLLVNHGEFKIVVPHKDRPEAWQLTHRTFFNENTFKWFEYDEVPQYGFKPWRVKELIVNHKNNIHCVLQKYESTNR